ncbi:MAG: hypothetical protein JWL92_251 [Candidatus Nomurabacteria bacterium]|nr:hypothetical protein [Candidatus Nomurabacteria bacterium]
MKRNSIVKGFIILAFAFAVMVTTSCSKENGTPTPNTTGKTVKEYLTSSAWKRTGEYTLNADNSVKTTEVLRALTITFKADGTYTSTDGPGNWSLPDDQHIIIFEPGSTTSSHNFVITAITATDFAYIAPGSYKATFTH